MTVVSPLLYEMISCEFLSSLILQFFKEERERQTTARADGWMKEEETKTTCDPCLNDFSVRKSSFFPPEMREFGKWKKIIRRKQTTPNNNIRSIGIRKNREKKNWILNWICFLRKKTQTNKLFAANPPRIAFTRARFYFDGSQQKENYSKALNRKIKNGGLPRERW